MKTYTELLPHQVAAVEKLRHLKVGALYMEMGTGKTRTALELIKLRLDAGKIDQIIWLCPCSVKGNLQRDIKYHSDLCNSDIITICGIETLSTSIQTNLDLLKKAGKRTFLVVDESSLVKNPYALRSIHITHIADKCQYKLILNGTPVTKFEADLFSQWKILDWRILGYRSFYSFAANHLEYDPDRPGRIVRALNIEYLSRKISPYTFQCRKKDAFTLPPKKSSEVGFFMTPEQDEMYEFVIERLLFDLDEMRDAAIYQLFGALQSVVSGFSVKIDENNHVIRVPMFAIPESNPRVDLLLSQIRNIPGEDKVLIFCTYTQEIHDIADALERKYPNNTVTFYGEVPQKVRQERIENFRHDKRFFVANKNCGAYGLNLQFCHWIIFYSNDWNWGTRAQAEDRVHRYGQNHIVNIIDLEAYNSIDQQILRCLHRKEALVDSFKSELDRQKAVSFLKGGAKSG